MTANEQRNVMTTRKSDILIVEDNDLIRQLLCDILEKSGYNVRPAPDGVTALEELRVKIPDILLSDLYMPLMSGFELLPIVRKKFPMTRVVAMSGAFSENDLLPGVTADAFYPKASRIDGLLEIIETMACPEASQLCAPHPECATQT